MNRPLLNPLWSFYGFTILWSFNLTGGLWILYLLHCHWSLWQVGLAESGFHLVSFMSDVPTGAFADRFGRKRSLVVGLIIGDLTTLTTFWSAPHSVWLGTLSVSLGALSWTFIGGADRALLYRLVAEHPEGLSYGRIYGRVLASNLLSRSLALALGGFLVVHLGWIWPYLGTLASTLLAILLVFHLPELPSQPPASHHWIGDVRTALSVARRIPGLTLLILFVALLSTLVTTNNLYAQSTLVSKGASLSATTLIIALANLLSALGSLVGGSLAHRGWKRSLFWGTSLLGLLIAGIGVLPLGGAQVTYLGAAGLDGGLDPIYETALNQATPEAHRATILSLPSTGFSLGMILLFPLAGWGFQQHQLPLVYLVMGLGMILWAGFWIRRDRLTIRARTLGGS